MTRELYTISTGLNRAAVRIDKSEWSGSERFESAAEIMQHCGKFLTREFGSWICYLSERQEFRANMNKFISLQKPLKDEPPGPMRSKLVDESSILEKRLTQLDACEQFEHPGWVNCLTLLICLFYRK